MHAKAHGFWLVKRTLGYIYIIYIYIHIYIYIYIYIKKKKAKQNKNKIIIIIIIIKTKKQKTKIMPVNFREINRYVLTSYCNTIGQSNNASSILLVFFGQKTKSPCSDLFTHWLIKKK